MSEGPDFKTGDLVWFEPNIGFPLPGEIQEVHQAAQIVIVNATIDGKQQTFTLAKNEGNLSYRQDLGHDGAEDLTQLEDLHEASLLWNLRARYDDSKFYTYAGSILISINPYIMYPDLYGLETAKKYKGAVLGELPPHLFAIGQSAYSALVNQRQNQAIVISGESGSGKTESNKLIMQYLAAIVPGSGSHSNKITEQILEASPLLESFGNAKTSKNDNSSRFGKYLEVYFKNGAIIGAKITQYLLEKSRIVTQSTEERNYHIFYELLGGLNEADRTKYGLLEADKYFYLNQGSNDCSPNGSCKEWSSLQGAMQVLGFSDVEREGIIRVLAAVLHLGNVYFHRRQLRNSMEGVELGSEGAECKWASHLLEISSEGLIRSLKTRLTETRNELLYTPLTIDQALDARDAFAKALYSGLFSWLVSRINSIIHKGGTHDAQRISILDIFGFESLEENSFEQLCINYANESLQLYFNKHVFKMEQAEYAKERLEWENLEWEDNMPVIHLLAKKPVGIFHLLDDESNFPRASDASFLEKCHYNHALNELYSRPRIGASEFGITHYAAGLVWYNVDGFLEKNRDALRPEVLELLSESSLPLVQDMTKQLRAQREGKTLPRGSNGRFVTMKPRTPTVSARFSDSLQQLLTSMSKCNPWFVRCIKPNNDKQARKVDMPCLLNQVRFLGLLSTVKIRKQGYPVRLRFQHFVERYRHLLKLPIPRGTPYRDLCRMVLDSQINFDEHDYQLGATRVFLRETLHRKLESGRNGRLNHAAIVIQKNVRTMLRKRRSNRQQESAVLLQKVYRGYSQRKKYQDLKNGVVKAQALVRGRIERKRYEKIKYDLKRGKEAEKVKKERAIQRIQKEQATERNSIMQLDVPAELAFIFSKLEGWNQLHGDRNLVKVVGTVPGPPIAPELPMDLEQFAFGKFSSVYCNGIQLHTRKDPISYPFLSRTAARDKDFQDALSIFKLILRWMGDPSLDANKDKVLADYIVNKGLSSRSLRDEILVQLCNQVYGADENQSLRVWQLMSHCLSSFQPGTAFCKYLMKFIKDNAPAAQRELLLKKILRSNNSSVRLYPPTYLEWRAAKQSDVALGLTLPDGKLQTVAIDPWTTCEEAASLSLAMMTGFQAQGWTVVLDDMGTVTDTCGLDYILDLIGEKELCPAFPSLKNDMLRTNGRKMSQQPSLRSPRTPTSPGDIEPLKRPLIPPPAPPQQMKIKNESHEREKIHVEYTRNDPPRDRKKSIDLLSRSSALNERYFEIEKSRSRSLDDLMNSDSEQAPAPEVMEVKQPLNDLGLSGSRLNDRYHSAERLIPVKLPLSTNRLMKQPPYVGKRAPSTHSGKYMDRSELLMRSSGMSDTSETPSLASHVRRVRVPSQASDVDQFLDDLFSPVLDGNLDELSDARSLAASIRGSDYVTYAEAPILDEDVAMLMNANLLCRTIKGGGDEDEDEIIVQASTTTMEEYITDLFQPIFMNENIRNLAEKEELADVIRGGGSGTNGEAYQSHTQRAFLESAMEQNIKIQQQLIAQNEALQTLLCQQGESTSPLPSHNTQTVTQTKTVFKFNESSYKDGRARKDTAESNGGYGNPPPPPPMPPPLVETDPFQRPFMDPYGRAKTVRIGKWRWPPPDNIENAEDFIAFKLLQKQRKTTPQSMQHSTSNGSMDDSRESIEWEKYDAMDGQSGVEKSKERFKSEPVLNKAPPANRVHKRSFDIGAERPIPNSVGKLKLSTEMRQRLEQVTAGHSVRSTTSNRSDMASEKQPVKLDEARKMMLEQQLGGSHMMSVRTQIQRMEASKIQKPFMPLPSIPAPPPPIRPPNSIPPAPPMQHHQKEKIPSFVQRMDKDTFGIKDSYTDSWERAEAEKLDMIYDMSKRSRSHSRERENFAESVWDRSEVEGPPSNDEAYKSNIRDRSRQSEMSQIQRERESQMVYQPKMSEREKKNSASEKATFKSHMFSQKERERKTSSSTLQSHRERFDDSEYNVDDFATSAIPKPVHATPMLKTPSACLTYNARVPWKLRVKKEVFRPSESLGPPAAIDLLFAQIVTDVFGPCLRLSQQEKRNAISFLSSHGVDMENMRSQVRNIVKRQLIEMARSWPLYFARLFIVNGSPTYPDVTIMAVHHTGVFLARKDNDSLTVSRTILFEDLQSVVTLPRPAALQLALRNGNRFVLHASKASAIQTFLQSFLHEFNLTQSKHGAVSSGGKPAATSNASEKQEASLIANVIKESEQVNMSGSKRSEENGFYHQNAFAQQQQKATNGHHHETGVSRQEESSPTQTSIVKHSLLQFALQHFRNDVPDEAKNRSEKRGPSDRLHASLVKWQGHPLQSPLLKLPADLTDLALECFECILRYCGDLPQDHNFSEVKCVYTVLMHCHKHLILRDEVYCQLMKQTTANRSTFPDSSQRAWRLLSILAAYFGCSEALKPYLIEHLTSAATDRRGTAAVCLTNLRKTARCGGRKNVPSVEEVTAVSAGRSARRQIYRLPGGAERVVNTRCSTVVADVISELCSLLGIENEAEQREFSLYCIVQGDAFTMPLSSDEYILDVTTELLKTNQPFYLIFCRSVWHFPLKKEPPPTPLYIEVLFNQVAPDYLEGLLLEIPNMGTPSPDYIRDIARIAAILHRAADLNHIPVMKEIKFLLPKPALGLREIKPTQWVNLVQAEFVKVLVLTPLQCKAQFLSVLSAWPLFGSSFFAVKRVFGDDVGMPEDEAGPMWRELILAINHRGVLFLDSNTHETLHHWQFIEIISTRKVRSEDALFLDMKVGNLLQQSVIRVQTEQAHEISRIIRQYITMASPRDHRE